MATTVMGMGTWDGREPRDGGNGGNSGSGGSGGHTAPATGPAAGKYLTCFLGAEEYGLPILQVQEIVGLLPITPVPQMAAHVLGVVNLRGKVIPVLDLRTRFGLPRQEPTVETCIVFVESGAAGSAGGAGGRNVGVVVDRVSEVLDIAAADVEPPPALGRDVDTAYLRGIAKAGGRVRLLLDVERVLAGGAPPTSAT
jgi:purine-binding chemotaxis protein CheW